MDNTYEKYQTDLPNGRKATFGQDSNRVKLLWIFNDRL